MCYDPLRFILSFSDLLTPTHIIIIRRRKHWGSMGLPTPMLVALSPTVPQFRYPLGAGWGPGWNLSENCLELVGDLPGDCLEDWL